MSTIERVTITIPSEMLTTLRAAVEGGDYASTSEVVREALRDWKAKRDTQVQDLVALKADIARGLADLSAGRVVDFDKDAIVERGRALLAARSASD